MFWNKFKYWMVFSVIFIFQINTKAQLPKPYGAIPTQRQIEWQETGMYCIIHFSVATYTDKEWGYGDENPEIFNPSKFNALQIVDAAKAGGFKGIIVVAKHHDGFCLWPTKTTTHNITASPYKNGKGDLVKEYADACKKSGLKMGIYCSPWDRNNGLYGKPEYVTDVYRKQLEELYSGYGNFFMSWHDGANGGDGFYGGANEVRKIDRSVYYDWDSTFKITRAMQPNACIFGDIGPDVRWVGNEDGFAGETYWATYTPQAPDEGKRPSNGYVKSELGTEGTRNGKYWMPAECDVPLRPGWFYHTSQDGQTKSAFKLLDIYYKSVGRGACLDLGLSPDKDGQLTGEDVNVLKQFGRLLQQTFAINLASGATFTASNIRSNNKIFSSLNLIDDDRYSYWATDDSVHNPELIITLPAQKTFNVIRLRENIKLGQRIEGATIDAWLNNNWKQIAAVTSIGANKLIRIPLTTTNKLRLRITASPVCIALSDFGLFKQPEQLPTPLIARNNYSEIIINTNSNAVIRYTTNGAAPTAVSKIYTNGFSLVDGGIIKAALFKNANQVSDVATKQFRASAKNWKVIGNANNDLNKMFDDNDSTFYQFNINKKLPFNISVDMNKMQKVKAFIYLPEQNKNAEMVNRYSFAISNDGNSWQTVAQGEFANIQSNPVEQLVNLKSPVKARYFQFTINGTTGNGNVISIANLGIY